MNIPLSTDGPPLASPRVLGIVGLGLIGTSVALAARRRWPDIRIAGVDLPATLLHPTLVAVLDVASPDLSAIDDAEIVVLATPVDVIRDLLPALAARAGSARLISDTGSTKRDIVTAAAAAGLRTFVGGHPMAGAAGSGPELARAGLFDQRRWFLTETADGGLAAVAQEFVCGLGARPEVVAADLHDEVMAAVSQLPQMVASLLMTLVGEQTTDQRLAWAGAGLRDTTRLAASPPGMWPSVLAANADHLAPLLMTLGQRLQAAATQLGRPADAARLFHDASAARRRLDRTGPL